MNQGEFVYFWFRRDLRLQDNHGLYQALQSGKAVIPVFIFDKNILQDLKSTDSRVPFIHKTIANLKTQLQSYNSDLFVLHSSPAEAWNILFNTHGIADIYCNEDYEPYGIDRDQKIASMCKEMGVQFHGYLDHLLLHPNAVLKDDGNPYTVFTPYHKKRQHIVKPIDLEPFPSEKILSQCANILPTECPTMEELGFNKSHIEVPTANISENLLAFYEQKRDFPSLNATSHIGPHIRFGTLSIRECYRLAQLYSPKWSAELDWREFYMQILFHFPKVVTQSFKSDYDKIEWRNNETDFESWKAGQTGYPIVDAGMRELMATGYMHNRVRMIVASFLCKHLLIDWRWGEAWFAEHLLDFELSSNNGGWQWAAGCGVDAAPYFRIFNPTLQTQKFDSNLEYIKKWVPEFATFSYPRPIVNHEMARKRCLDVYKKAISI